MKRKWIVGTPGADKCRRVCRFFFAVLFSLLAAPGWAAVTFDKIVSNSTTVNSVAASSPVFSTGSGNEVLLAFIATDYLSGPNTTVTNVNGAGLTWVLVVRSNTQAGSSEIWRAFAPNPLTNVTVTATLSQAVMSSITVMAFIGADTSGTNGSGAIGATAATNSTSGAPAAAVVTTRADSMVLGVGNDYDNAIPRTPGIEQVVMQQYLTSLGDTYWVQRHLNVYPANTPISIDDTAPDSDQYNLAVVEVLASPGPQTWSLSGTALPVFEANGTVMFIPGALISTTVDSSGHFTFTGIPNGTYTVTPSKPGYIFSPTEQTVTINGANVTGINFTVLPVPTTWSISGTISPPSSGSGTVLSIPGALISTTADSSGHFGFANMPNGLYTVRPSKAGYTFSPIQRSVTINGGNVSGVDFTIQPVTTTWTVSGAISPASGGSGAVLTLLGTPQLTTTADSSGNFSFPGVPDGVYTAYATKAGYTFPPGTRSVTVNGGNVTGVDFTAQAIPTFWKISGTVTPGSYGVSASMILGESGDVLVDTAGNYQFVQVPNGTFTVIPNKPGYAFSPRSLTVTVNGADITGVNFTIEPAGQWSASFDLGIVAANMVMTHTGNVLMYSGSSTTSGTERLFNPATGQNWPVANPYSNLFGSGHSQLADGRILVVGGYDPSSLGAANASIFDPVSPSWTALPNMSYRRWHPSATTLGDGRVARVVGRTNVSDVSRRCPGDLRSGSQQVHDSAGGAARRSVLPVHLPASRRQGDRRRRHCGSRGHLGAGSVSAHLGHGRPQRRGRSQCGDVPAGQDSEVRNSDRQRRDRQCRGDRLRDRHDAAVSRVAAGGVDGVSSRVPQHDAAAGRHRPRDRRRHRARRLRRHQGGLRAGAVVAVNGNVDDTAARRDSAAVSFDRAAAAGRPRVLVAGSGSEGRRVNQTQRRDLLAAVSVQGSRGRPSRGAPAIVEYGATFTVDTPDAAIDCRVSLIRPGAVTHGFDQDQRILSLAFTAGSGDATCRRRPTRISRRRGTTCCSSSTSPVCPRWHRSSTCAPGTDVAPPTPPIEPGQAAGDVGSATLTWSASTDNIGRDALQRIHRSAMPGIHARGWRTHAGPSTSTGFTNIGVPSNTYLLHVTARTPPVT